MNYTRPKQRRPLLNCSFEGCDKIAIARDLCSGHYGQFKRGKQLTVLRPKRKVVAGEKYNLLTALSPTEEKYCGSTIWLARCDCGKVIKIRSSLLIARQYKSCGCLRGGTSSSRLKASYTRRQQMLDEIEQALDEGLIQ